MRQTGMRSWAVGVDQSQKRSLMRQSEVRGWAVGVGQSQKPIERSLMRQTDSSTCLQTLVHVHVLKNVLHSSHVSLITQYQTSSRVSRLFASLCRENGRGRADVQSKEKDK